MKGRKPNSDAVVPFKDGQSPDDFAERAWSISQDLKPENLTGAVSDMWDRIAPPLCMPTRRYPLDVASTFMFEQLCHIAVRVEELRKDIAENGEEYRAETRNGVQFKSRPSVGQLNEAFRQLRGLAGEFGMTPSTARAVAVAGQLSFAFDDDDADFD